MSPSPLPSPASSTPSGTPQRCHRPHQQRPRSERSAQHRHHQPNPYLRFGRLARFLHVGFVDIELDCGYTCNERCRGGSRGCRPCNWWVLHHGAHHLFDLGFDPHQHRHPSRRAASPSRLCSWRSCLEQSGACGIVASREPVIPRPWAMTSARFAQVLYQARSSIAAGSVDRPVQCRVQ